MPIYEYECDRGHHVELQRNVADRDLTVCCKECGNSSKDPRGTIIVANIALMHRVPSLVSPQFPGADRWR
jgi:putative FmdB family regulatory protein